MIPGDGVKFYRNGSAICREGDKPWCEDCHLGNHACGEVSWCRHRTAKQHAQASCVGCEWESGRCVQPCSEHA